MRNDEIQRYLFRQPDVRGELVSLEATYARIGQGHDYPPAVAQLLGELLAATALLTATLKFEGQITVQLQGDGPINFAVINGDHLLNFRGVARYRTVPEAADLPTLLGKGYLIITLTPAQGERYQGIVALDQPTLAGCLERYFAQSEQLLTHVWLHVANGCAGGILLQALPQAVGDVADSMAHLSALTATLKAEELFSLNAEEVLYRLYHQEEVELFPAAAISFQCGCADGAESALLQMGETEAYGIIAEQGQLCLHCDYCHADYIFSAAEVRERYQAVLH